MPKIQVMSETLASQVAAGEVIERPASVIKELIENSLDAGARKIEVEIARGGSAMLRVRDDGCGMSREDAIRSLERHATSKLRSSEDLNTISTLGFRGEALPSIASISRFSMTSREAEAVAGTEVRVEGGEVIEPREIGCPVGTQIEVRDLFFNVPARRKFLKAETTEAAHIDHQIRLHALSSPGVGWVFRKDGRVVLDLPATSDRRVRIEAMTGSESGRELVLVPRWEGRGISVEGAVLPASFARRGRKHQYVFLNGRPVEDGVISRALREAFQGVLQEGMQPAAWLWLKVDPAMVDVNVHPAKREVRFRESNQVRVAILDAVTAALKPPERVMEREVGERAMVGLEVVDGAQRVVRTEVEEVEREVVERVPEAVWRHEEQEELAVEEEDPVHHPEFRVIGELSNRYVLLEGEEGLVLFEPGAAKERIHYEELLEKESEVASQGLLVPVLLELDARDVDLLMRHREHFDGAGFTLENFGGRTVQISAVPSFLKSDDHQKTLTELIDAILDREGGGRVRRLAYEGFAAQVAKVSARAGQKENVEGLLGRLFRCDLPYCDPAGRPTLVQISYQELDRKFGK